MYFGKYSSANIRRVSSSILGLIGKRVENSGFSRFVDFPQCIQCRFQHRVISLIIKYEKRIMRFDDSRNLNNFQEAFPRDLAIRYFRRKPP